MEKVARDTNADRQLLDSIIEKQDLAEKQTRFLNALGVSEELGLSKHVRFEEVDRKPVGLHIFEVIDLISDSAIDNNESWQDVEFEVALDSGSQDHVCDEVDCPGYVTEVSPGSSRGQCFVVGNGERLPNMGQRKLNLQPLADSSTDLTSCFQIAKVTRPLMSVGRICDNGMDVTFSKTQAIVKDADGSQVCVFERKPGGLYTCKFRLKNPLPGFTRQGKDRGTRNGLRYP